MECSHVVRMAGRYPIYYYNRTSPRQEIPEAGTEAEKNPVNHMQRSRLIGSSESNVKKRVPIW